MMEQQPTSTQKVDHSVMKRLNRSLILSHLRRESNQTRASLAATTGMTRATVSQLVAELIDAQFVREGTQLPSTKHGGRRGTTLTLDPRGGAAIGIAFQSQSLTVRVSNFVGKSIWQHSTQVELARPAALVQIEHILSTATQFINSQSLPLLGVGIGISGSIDARQGIVRRRKGPGWNSFPLGQYLTELLGVPVFIDNDANVSAVGERACGSGDYANHFVFLDSSADGIGAGVFCSGQLLHGVGGFGGEIGHMQITSTDTLCHCGRSGCWNVLLNLAEILQLARDEAYVNDLARMKAVAEADDGSLFNRLVSHLAPGVANVINIFDPEHIVLGGLFTPFGTPLAQAVAEAACDVALEGSTENLKISMTTLDNACLEGATTLVLDSVQRPSIW